MRGHSKDEEHVRIRKRRGKNGAVKSVAGGSIASRASDYSKMSMREAQQKMLIEDSDGDMSDGEKITLDINNQGDPNLLNRGKYTRNNTQQLNSLSPRNNKMGYAKMVGEGGYAALLHKRTDSTKSNKVEISAFSKQP